MKPIGEGIQSLVGEKRGLPAAENPHNQAINDNQSGTKLIAYFRQDEGDLRSIH
jgi:hypothetical protein